MYKELHLYSSIRNGSDYLFLKFVTSAVVGSKKEDVPYNSATILAADPNLGIYSTNPGYSDQLLSSSTPPPWRRAGS